MNPLLNIVLRGITGVGKSMLRQMLALALRKLGKKVGIISKDEHRFKIDDYSYSLKEEQMVSEWYRDKWLEMSARPDVDVTIIDCTNVRRSELLTTLVCRGDPERKIINVLIQIGDFMSDVQRKPKIPLDVIARMREEMHNSESTVDEMIENGRLKVMLSVEPLSTAENGVQDIINELDEFI